MRIKVFAFFCVVASVITGCSRSKTFSIPFDVEIKDYTPVIRHIIQDNPKGGITFKFDKDATYPFYPEAASETVVYVTNNESGIRRVAFLLDNMKNVSIEGDNSTFLLHGGYIPLVARGCENLHISGINLDYDAPFIFEGLVIANDEDARSFTVKVVPGNENYYIADERLYFKGYDWEQPLWENIVFDPTTRRPIYNTTEYESWAKMELRAEDLEKGVVKFTNVSSRKIPPVGSVYVDKGENNHNRLYPGFILSETKDILVENVNVYNSGGMSLVGQYCENVTLNGFNTVVKEGSPRMIASSADATHFVDCKGDIVLENCRFESMLDDATNVHGVYMKMVEKLSPYKFAADFGHWQQQGNVFARKGARLQFVDKATMRPVGEGVVKSIEKVSANWYEIETDFDLSGYSDKPNLAIKNLDQSVSSVTVRNCVVRYNRARSLLISCPGDVLIEDNYFASQMAGIYIAGDANYWFESGDTQNIVIRHNKFDDEGIFCGSPQGVLQVEPVIMKASRGTDFFYHANIVFEDNEVNIFDNLAILALSVGNLEIRNNRFIDNGLHPVRFPECSVIDAQYCGSVTVEGNDFSKWKKDATISIDNCLETKIQDCYPVVDKPRAIFSGD